MSSRWQANKIGLVNFWYYDEQEFPFVKGRMLLRGSNGSGKSVTMQSAIPLLLDGNMSPERLDPFGSRDRKMSSYLLEEDDSREERTGYLYLEFRRQESDTYMTIGMGIRARKGKPLDKWYFGLADGRRIGKDFFLYKETGEKIPLSKKELENRIAAGGSVFERQQDYMEYVNRHIFGFESAEEYKEMVDLLIQLRTPKLSKDFKPSVVNEILSDSLQPLSDEDLRPMAEAIENMDTNNMNLKNRTEEHQAAGRIMRVLGRYDRMVLYRKAADYENNTERLKKFRKDEEGHRTEKEKCSREHRELEEKQESLIARKAAMDKELDSLRKSDAVGLNNRKLELEQMLENRKNQLNQKEEQLGAKEESRIDIENKCKAADQMKYEKEQEINSLLEDMESHAEDMAFQEYHFFQEEFREAMDENISFESHRKVFDETRNRIRKGREILSDINIKQSMAEEVLKRRDKKQQEADLAQRRETELVDYLAQVEDEWKEKLYTWNGENKELKIPEEMLKEFSAFADHYGINSDFADIRNKISGVWIDKKAGLESELHKAEEKEKILEEEVITVRTELKEWENNKEPEPLRSEAVLKNREKLRKAGVPFIEFYKVLEFEESLEKTVCDRLEEALLEMGILDALVVDEQYREVVLAADPGCCDRYLFAGRDRVPDSILDMLNLDEGADDIFMNQRLTSILSGISRGDIQAATAVLPDGTYRIGAVTGTVSGIYEAGFIGAQARERKRQAQIEICLEKIRSLEEELQTVRETKTVLGERLVILEKEYRSLPDDEDMREALHMLEDIRQKAAGLKQECQRLEEEYKVLAEEVQEKYKEALVLAEKLYISCNFSSFARADEAAQEYHTCLNLLKSCHEMYRHQLIRLEELKEQLEDLDADLDQIRCEIRDIRREIEKMDQEYDSVVQQLSLTDYEQISARLNECTEWLNNFPDLLTECTKEQTQREDRIKALDTLLEEDRANLEECIRKEEFFRQRYLRELKLGYVEIPEKYAAGANKTEESEAVDFEKMYPPLYVRRFLEDECRKLKENDVVQELSKVYYENAGFLNEYQIKQTEILAEPEDEVPEGCDSGKRLDITAKYKGVQIPFHQLTPCLAEEIEGLRELIKAGDRELFEDILANTVGRKIRGKINSSNTWVIKMNSLMEAMNTSSGLRLSLKWRSKSAETEDQMDTKELVDLLKKDYRTMRDHEAEKLSRHFRSKVEIARRNARESGGMISFYQMMKDALDYRKWFEFQLFSCKKGEKVRELTNSIFGTFSGGEKAMAMYVPLFSAVVAKYQGGNSDAPRLISLDEAFAGVDNRNIRDMFRLMTEFEFDFIINSQVLWGDCDTLDALAIYQLLRPENAKFVTVMPYMWNGQAREMLENEKEAEERARELTKSGEMAI